MSHQQLHTLLPADVRGDVQRRVPVVVLRVHVGAVVAQILHQLLASGVDRQHQRLVAHHADVAVDVEPALHIARHVRDVSRLQVLLPLPARHTP